MREDLENLQNGIKLSGYVTSVSTGVTSGDIAAVSIVDNPTSALANPTLVTSISNDQLDATAPYPYYGEVPSVATTLSDYSLSSKGMSNKLDDLMDHVKALTCLVKSLRPDLDMSPDSILGFLSTNHPDILQKYMDYLDEEKK